VDNLFIASPAVFRTSSQANPALTIVALSLRLADHLEALAASGRPAAATAASESLVRA
jgi:choline dehydrogenase-like flavoprotein